MTTHSDRVRIEGYLLHRMIFEPEASVGVKAAALFYHGQGDYAERYTDVLGVFTNRGIRCIITELPGHGHSPGRRGHCGDEALLDKVISDTLNQMGDQPYGVMGHSMGGLLTLRHLIQAGRGRYPVPEFAWVSSPLVKPGNGHSRWYKTVARFFSAIIPQLTVSTGLTTQMCRVESPGADQPAPPPKHQLWHRRVSLGWGATLLGFEDLIHSHASDIPANVPLIYTQGAEDPVCPAKIAREFFATLPNTDKRYHEFEGMLHEPFSGEGNEKLFKALEDWLAGLFS